MSLATFPNEPGLERLGGILWATTAELRGHPSWAPPDTAGFGSTIGGELEKSNVDLATEMTNMITAERGYQANSRIDHDRRRNAGSHVIQIAARRRRGRLPDR